VSTLRDYARFGQMLLNEGELEGTRLLQPETVRLLARDWLNDFTTEKRKQPLWVWGTPGIGFSPLGQIGVAHPEAGSRRVVGSALHTVHWGGAGGSGYMFNWPHRVQVLTYTGCAFDTATQKALWRAAFGALRRGGARPLRSPRAPLAAAEAASETPVKKRPLGRSPEVMKRPLGRHGEAANEDSEDTPENSVKVAASGKRARPSPRSERKS